MVRKRVCKKKKNSRRQTPPKKPSKLDQQRLEKAQEVLSALGLLDNPLALADFLQIICKHYRYCLRVPCVNLRSPVTRLQATLALNSDRLISNQPSCSYHNNDCKGVFALGASSPTTSTSPTVPYRKPPELDTIDSFPLRLDLSNDSCNNRQPPLLEPIQDLCECNHVDLSHTSEIMLTGGCGDKIGNTTPKAEPPIKITFKKIANSTGKLADYRIINSTVTNASSVTDKNPIIAVANPITGQKRGLKSEVMIPEKDTDEDKMETHGRLFKALKYNKSQDALQNGSGYESNGDENKGDEIIGDEIIGGGIIGGGIIGGEIIGGEIIGGEIIEGDIGGEIIGGEIIGGEEPPRAEGEVEKQPKSKKLKKSAYRRVYCTRLRKNTLWGITGHSDQDFSDSDSSKENKSKSNPVIPRSGSSKRKKNVPVKAVGPKESGILKVPAFIPFRPPPESEVVVAKIAQNLPKLQTHKKSEDDEIPPADPMLVQHKKDFEAMPPEYLTFNDDEEFDEVMMKSKESSLEDEKDDEEMEEMRKEDEGKLQWHETSYKNEEQMNRKTVWADRFHNEVQIVDSMKRCRLHASTFYSRVEKSFQPMMINHIIPKREKNEGYPTGYNMAPNDCPYIYVNNEDEETKDVLNSSAMILSSEENFQVQALDEDETMPPSEEFEPNSPEPEWSPEMDEETIVIEPVCQFSVIQPTPGCSKYSEGKFNKKAKFDERKYPRGVAQGSEMEEGRPVGKTEVCPCPCHYKFSDESDSDY